MITSILVPKLGMTQSEVTVVKWHKGDGERAEKGETVVTIETAKVTNEIEAPAAGLLFTLRKIKEKVQIGDALGVIADNKEEFEEYTKGMAPDTASASDIFLEEDVEDGWGVHLSIEEEGKTSEASAQPEPSPTIEVGDRVVTERIPFVGMRRTIADNLMRSLHSGAQLTVVCETDMTDLANFRKELLLDRPDQRITFVDMLVKILAQILKEFPIINSTISGDEVICWGEYHIGVAVALEGGLVVPVVRNADRKSLVAVSREIKKLARKAHNNALEPEHYQGGTFTLSSGGNVAVDFMTPIINPPENAILGIGRIGPKPAVHKNELAIRTMTHLCLTHDHRVIDGVPAAMFLGRLKETIENPKEFRKILK